MSINDTDFDLNGIHDSHFWGDKRHYVPWYDTRADYNTNAKSYYDYLGFRIEQIDKIIESLQSLLARTFVVDDSDTIDMTAIQNWDIHDITQTVAEIKADVKLSIDRLNAIQIHGGGLYVKDLQPDITILQQQLSNLSDRVKAVEDQADRILSQLNELKDGYKDDVNKLNDRINALYTSLQKLQSGILQFKEICLQVQANIRNMWKWISYLNSERTDLWNAINGSNFKNITSNTKHYFYNGGQEVPDGWGTFRVQIMETATSATVHVRFPWANHSFSKLELNGGIVPLTTYPMSYIGGWSYTGDYDWLNSANVVSWSISNGAPHIAPASQRASWQIGYNLDLTNKRELHKEPVQITMATFADGYNNRTTLQDHYSNLSLTGDILNITLIYQKSSEHQTKTNLPEIPKDDPFTKDCKDISFDGDDKPIPDEPYTPVDPTDPKSDLERTVNRTLTFNERVTHD